MNEFLRLLAAVLVGGLLGFDRELHRKAAGIRTLALVSLGSALVTLISVQAIHTGPSEAVTRTIQGIITGIGFLGAGVILQGNQGRTVYGLTTAASVWVAAGLGVACGLGEWKMAALGTSLTIAVLVLGRPVEALVVRYFASHGKDFLTGDTPPEK